MALDAKTDWWTEIIPKLIKKKHDLYAISIDGHLQHNDLKCFILWM